ncbi:MAG: hypothetical protein HY880_06840 [Deltaproteobacteria bacterium]|nr:hypothetical protein [Deltaproteobacteria bacterium]
MSLTLKIIPRVFFIPIFVFIVSCAHHAKKEGETPYALKGDKDAPITSMSASAIVELARAEGASLKGRANVLVKSPDLFRIEVRGPFNQTIALVIGNGSDTVFFSNGAVKRNSFPFDASETVNLLLGRWDIAVKNGSGLRIIEKKDGQITKVEYFFKSADIGAPGYPSSAWVEVSFSDYKEITDTLFFPLTVSIETDRERLDISYVSIELNSEIDGTAFNLLP